MPKVLSRKTSHVKPQFTPYGGDEPPTGRSYRAVIKQMSMQKSATSEKNPNGADMYFVVAELKAKDGSAMSQYDGYPAFVQLVLGDHDIQVEREQALYQAISGKEDADIDMTSANLALWKKVKPGDKQRIAVEKVGGKKPEGTVCLVRLVTEDGRVRAEAIYPSRENPTTAADVADDEDDEDIEIDADGDDEELVDYTEEDLLALALPALRKILVDEFEMDAAEAAKLKQKAKLVAAILEAQSDVPEEPEDEDEEEEDLDEEEEDDEEEEEDEDEDPMELLREELAALSRNELKVRLRKAEKAKGVKEPFKVTTKTTEPELIETIVGIETVPF